MKLTKIIWSTIIIAALASAGLSTVRAEDSEKPAQKPKITKSEAKKIALAKVPNGKVKEAELEMEKGKLIWSFDIKTPGTKDITEVNVDANTGEVVNVEAETPEQQAKEAAEEAKEKKAGKDDDEKDQKK
jgi:hypothetical protein